MEFEAALAGVRCRIKAIPTETPQSAFHDTRRGSGPGNGVENDPFLSDKILSIQIWRTGNKRERQPERLSSTGAKIPRLATLTSDQQRQLGAGTEVEKRFDRQAESRYGGWPCYQKKRSGSQYDKQSDRAPLQSP